MENSHCALRQQPNDEPEIDFREWALKAKIGRENAYSRRHSASYIGSLREEARSFRSNITIASTASSPGYPFCKDEIDPATYSFTTALKALQARSNNSSWECMSPDGFALHSKWNEAEKYICNPLSGEFPVECLSAKTLSRRSFQNYTNRITMSAPLVYPSQSRLIQTRHSMKPEEDLVRLPIQEKKMLGSTKDVGVQSAPVDLSSSSSSSGSASPVEKKSSKQFEPENGGLSNDFDSRLKSEKEVRPKETKQHDEALRDKEEGKGRDVQAHRYRQSGCFSWVRTRHREKQNPKKKHKIFLPHVKRVLKKV